MSMEMVEMTGADYEDALALWHTTEGSGLTPADSREGIQLFLERDPGLSLVVRESGRLIGTILCGHDGRRGYLHHVAVGRPYQGRGIGRTLVQASLAKLAGQGIHRCHTFIRADNRDGKRFWRTTGWTERTDLIMVSKEMRPTGGDS
jgi:ribosomal protein S18 acetylase RimI-like enzyme